jgi:hypothetical protein
MAVVRGSRSFLNYAEETAFNSGVASGGGWKNLPIISETFGETVNAIISTQIQPDRTVPDARGGNIMPAGGFTADWSLVRYLLLLKHLLGATSTPTFGAPASVVATTAYVRGVVKAGPAGNTKLYRCVVSGTTSAAPGADFVTNDGTVFSSGTSQWIWLMDAGTQTGSLYTGSPTLPSVGLLFERGDFADAAVQYFLAQGVRVESMTITQPQDGIASVVFALLAMQTASSPTVTLSGSPAPPTDEGVVGFESAVEILNGDGTIQASTAVKSGSLVVANNFETDNYRLGSRFRRDLVEKRRVLSGDLDLFFEDLTYYNRFKNETIFGIRWSWYHGNAYLSITLPECKFFGDPVPKIGGEGSVSSRFAYTPFRRLATYDIQAAYDVVA